MTELHANRKLQQGLLVLYPLLVGLFFVFFQSAFWLLAIGTMLVYCVLWKNLAYVLGSNLLLIALSVLLWVVEADYMRMGSVEKTRDWLPFAYVFYGLFCLLPPLLLVPIRNWLLRREARR